eukprot:comp20924_c2_seq1/m.27925 comp20924_c2_seq1/g.27925  ORF comp20924_c2_seq1/g.27925 comp20924_c2_seq1/m.27925 type:complete len:317 (-) comp20924_c2_seq1:208-1158(-)
MEDAHVDAVEGKFDEEDIDWKHLDKRRFYFFGTFMFFGVRAIVFPANLVKTRLQVHRRNSNYTSTLSTFRHVMRTEGIKGFYAGFPTTALGVIPAQVMYLTAYEIAREKARELLPHDHQEFYRNLMAGTCASLASQMVIVPVDVISQRLMVQGDADIQSSGPRLRGGRATAMHILQTSGVRGLYRGFFTSLATYAPSSGIWWATYGQIKGSLLRRVSEEQRRDYRVPIQAVAGMCAGATAATITNPMDVLKTRIQVAPGRDAMTVRVALQTLLREEGLMGFTNGLTAKIMNSAPVSVLMITVYELVKRLSVMEGVQ